MEQKAFEQAVLTILRQVPEQQRTVILKLVQTLARELQKLDATHEKRAYSVETRRKIRELTATISGNLAAAISVERDERG